MSGGDLLAPLDTLSSRLRVSVDDIRTELRRLACTGDISVRYSEPAHCVRLLKVALHDEAQLATQLADYATAAEASSVAKLDAVHSLLTDLVEASQSAATTHADADSTTPATTTESDTPTVTLHNSQSTVDTLVDHGAHMAIERYFAGTPPTPKQSEQTAPTWLRADCLTLFREHRIAPRPAARILHGVGSPAFPASTWASSSWWGKHADVAFELVLAACNNAARALPK